MLSIKILAVGQIKEKFYREAIAEFEKRLSRYTKLTIIEVPDEKTPDNASEAQNQAIKSKEGERLLKHIKENDFVITLEIKGKELDSQSLAQKLNQLAVDGTSSIVFVIGGSLGLSREVCSRSNFALSFSPMTFPHQLMRVILLEQIYRSFRINNNEPYHK